MKVKARDRKDERKEDGNLVRARSSNYTYQKFGSSM